MSRKLNRWGLVALLLALVVTFGCGGGEDPAAAQTANQDAAWSELQAQQAELEAKRQELRDLRDAAAQQGEEPAAPAEGEAPATAAADPEAEIARLESEVQQESEEFYQDLVEFINAAGLVEGEEPTGAVAEAIRMKSSEDMQVAQEYIDRGGNYRQAITIYETALSVDPNNAELQQALAEAEANRYMSEERFAAAKEDMTEAEVRAVLGAPFHANVRPFPEQNVVAWFYPVDETGSAAAVWFRQRDGGMKVYKTNFREVVKEGPTVVGEAPEST